MDCDNDEILSGGGGVAAAAAAAAQSSHTQIDQTDNPFLAPPDGDARFYQPLPHSQITITEATKVSEGSGRNYVAYTVKYIPNNTAVRRRYSDFETLRNILVRLFPVNLIPPIPAKQSIRNYSKTFTGGSSTYNLSTDTKLGSVDLVVSTINGHINNSDEKLIRHRIRMLTIFLNKLLQDDEINKTSIITDFLDPHNSNWNDFVNSSATFSTLPKNVLQCNPVDPTSTTRLHACLPIPTLSDQMTTKNDFQITEQVYKNYENLMKNGIYKYNKRITKTVYELVSCLKELTEYYATLSSFTHLETELAGKFAHMSNAFDELSTIWSNLIGCLYYNINEPLNEMVHMAGSVRELIHYRKLKFLQLEMVRKNLANKKAHLEKLQNINSNTNETSPSSYSGKLFNRFNKIADKIKESINYQETDPETMIPILHNEIKDLNESLELANNDLSIISNTIQNNRLPKFSQEKDFELNEIIKTYSKYMKEFAEKNLELWKQVKSNQNQ